MGVPVHGANPVRLGPFGISRNGPGSLPESPMAAPGAPWEAMGPGCGGEAAVTSPPPQWRPSHRARPRNPMGKPSGFSADLTAFPCWGTDFELPQKISFS